MNLKDLMSGIGVVIDDKVGAADTDHDGNASLDPISKIVRQIEDEWELACYTTQEMPARTTWPSLLRSASFVLLDWKMWPSGASDREENGIKQNIEFLRRAKDHLVPVLIFTNESEDDVVDKLPREIYSEEQHQKSFVFVRNKASLLTDGSVNFSEIEEWLQQNASVYALKVWESAFHTARKELFGSMFEKSPDWPRVFWKAYKDDGVDPSSSLLHLVNDNLRGRMHAGEFDEEILGAAPPEVPKEELRKLIGEISVRPQQVLPEGEIGCGDMFQVSKRKFLLNLRPDCDCVPRNGQKNAEIELYCIEGKKIPEAELKRQYDAGHFREKVWEHIVFSAHEAKSIRFNFSKFRIKKFGCLKEKRVGRLLHPYLTRVQQRFGLYLQRQGLPRIPEDAVGNPATKDLAQGEQ